MEVHSAFSSLVLIFSDKNNSLAFSNTNIINFYLKIIFLLSRPKEMSECNFLERRQSAGRDLADGGVGGEKEEGGIKER